MDTVETVSDRVIPCEGNEKTQQKTLFSLSYESLASFCLRPRLFTGI